MKVNRGLRLALCVSLLATLSAAPAALVEAPGNFSGVAISPTEITWSWDDVSDEIAYELHDEDHNVIETIAADTTSVTESNLTPGEEVCRHVAALFLKPPTTTITTLAEEVEIAESEPDCVTTTTTGGCSVEVKGPDRLCEEESATYEAEGSGLENAQFKWSVDEDIAVIVGPDTNPTVEVMAKKFVPKKKGQKETEDRKTLLVSVEVTPTEGDKCNGEKEVIVLRRIVIQLCGVIGDGLQKELRKKKQDFLLLPDLKKAVDKMNAIWEQCCISFKIKIVPFQKLNRQGLDPKCITGLFNPTTNVAPPGEPRRVGSTAAGQNFNRMAGLASEFEGPLYSPV